MRFSKMHGLGNGGEAADHQLADRFRQFVDEANSLDAPFYARLSAIVSRDAALLDLAAHCQATPVPNLFFSAIHFLLRRDDSDELAEYFRSLRISPRASDGLTSALKGFCHRHAGELQSLLETRRVQTNEVNRCAAFVPAFELVFRHGGGRVLGLIDLGTSAGLNLLWDHFHYRYGATFDVGLGDSPVLVECQLLGPVRPPVPTTFPAVGQRIGLDRAPINLENADQRAWLEALVWPDHPQRLARLRAAMDLARRTPPQLIAGDFRELLPGVLASVPSELTCCVFHSASFNQLGRHEQDEIDRQLLAASADRDVHRVGAEFEQLAWHRYQQGRTHSQTLLASFDSHGRWLRWNAE